VALAHFQMTQCGSLAFLFTMAITFVSISEFFFGELKLIDRAENALRSGRLLKFSYDGSQGVIRASVQPSMKKGSYTVLVSDTPTFSVHRRYTRCAIVRYTN